MAQGRQVDAALHAVTLDIRIDDEGRAVFLQAGQDIVYAQTGIGHPALGLEASALGIEGDPDLSGKGLAEGSKGFGLLQGHGTDDQALHTGFEIGTGRLFVTDAAAQLHGDIQLPADVAHDVPAFGQTVESAVQIDHMQPAGALVPPGHGSGHRIGGKHGALVGTSLFQADGLSVLDVDSGKDNHKFRSFTALIMASRASSSAVTHLPWRLKKSPTLSRFSVRPCCSTS